MLLGRILPFLIRGVGILLSSSIAGHCPAIGLSPIQVLTNAIYSGHYGFLFIESFLVPSNVTLRSCAAPTIIKTPT